MLHTCRVVSRAPTGEPEALEISGTLRGREESGGQNQEQQRGQRQHFRRWMILSSSVERLLKKQMEEQHTHTRRQPPPRLEGTSVSLRKVLSDLCCYYGYSQTGDVTPAIPPEKIG